MRTKRMMCLGISDMKVPTNLNSTLIARPPPTGDAPSLFDFLTTSLVSKIKTKTTDLLYWSTFDPTKGIFTLNDNFFLGSRLDFSGCSFWNGSQGGGGSGTLISSNIMICATHTYGGNGHNFTFIGRDGLRYWSKAIQRITIPPDISVVLLEEPMPEFNHAHYRLLPPDYAKYFTNTSWGLPTGIPLIVGGQRNAATTGHFLFGLHEIVLGWYHLPATDLLQPYAMDLIDGDSSHPTFLVFGNELVLTGCHYGHAYDPPLADNYNDLITAIDSLGGDRFDVVNLSKFKKYTIWIQLKTKQQASNEHLRKLKSR